MSPLTRGLTTVEMLASTHTSAAASTMRSGMSQAGDRLPAAFAEAGGAIRPEVPILFTSGYTHNAMVHHGRLDEGVHLPSKPYSSEELARKVAMLIKGDSAR